jgi:transcriptional regulator with XRE-family HTH domain
MKTRKATSFIDAHIGARLRSRRRELGVSQPVLGSSIGVSFQQLQKYETGANRPSASTLWRLACELRVPVAYFFDGLSPADPNEDRSEDAIARLLQCHDGMEFLEALQEITDPDARQAALIVLRALGGQKRGAPGSGAKAPRKPPASRSRKQSPSGKR